MNDQLIRLVTLLHAAFGQFLAEVGGEVASPAQLTKPKAPAEPQPRIVAASDVKDMTRAQLDGVVAEFSIPIYENGQQVPASTVRVTPLRQQVMEFFNKRNTQLSSETTPAANPIVEQAQQLPLVAPAAPVPVPNDPPILTQAPPAPPRVPTPPPPPAPPVVEEVAKVEPVVAAAPAVVPPPPVVAAAPAPAAVAAPPAAKPDFTAHKQHLLEIVQSRLPAEQAGCLWNFLTQVQYDKAKELEAFLQEQLKTLGEGPKATLQTFLKTQGCGGNCTKCPINPAQPCICYALFDDTTFQAADPLKVTHDTVIKSGVALVLKPIPAGKALDDNTNGVASF